MTTDENNDTPRGRHETVALTDLSSQKISRWIEQVATKRVRISRKEFMNWFIEKSADNLSNADLTNLADRYYDEEVFLRQLLREVKQAKKDGNEGHLEVVVRPRKIDSKKEATPPVVEPNSDDKIAAEDLHRRV